MVTCPVLSGVIFVDAIAAWWEAWLTMWGGMFDDVRRKTPPRSIREFIDQKYERLDERDHDRELDADMIDGSGGGAADGAGTGGQD